VNTTYVFDGLTEWVKAGQNLANNRYYNGTMNVSTLVNVWNYSGGAEIFSGSVVKDDIVYFGTMEADNTFYALNSTNGSLLWSYQATGGGLNAFASYPAISNGAVWEGSDNSILFKFNATTGEVMCNYTTGSYIDSGFAVWDGLVYFGGFDGNIYAINESNCSLALMFSAESQAEQLPVLDNGYIYESSRNKVYKLDAKNFSEIWEYSTFVGDGRILVGLNFYQDKVYFTTATSKRVYMINATDGTYMANYTMDGVSSSALASVVNDAYYISNSDGYFYKLNATDLSLIWKVSLSADWGIPVILSDNKVIVTTNSGFSVLNTADGSSLFSYNWGDYGTWATIIHGKLFVGSGDYKLHAFTFEPSPIVETTSVYSAVNSSIPSGSYKANYYCEDIFGNINDSESVDFFIEGGEEIIPLPSVFIDYPANATYNYNVTALNFTVINGTSCWYSLDSGITNISTSCSANVTGLNSADGSNTWTIYVNNSIGNESSDSITFDYTLSPVVVITETEGDKIRNLLASSGAGLGMFILFISQTLPKLLLGLLMVAIIVVVGYSLVKVIQTLGIRKS
jgi:outer membrane protein assembly factor BamB